MLIMNSVYDVVVVGGGASGLVAAATAAKGGCSVLLAEKMEKCGRKIRITGKGRCNITNMSAPDVFLAKVRSGADFVRFSLEALSPFDVRDMLEAAGVRTVEERGRRLFPASGKAFDVADALVDMAYKAGAEIVCHSPVTGMTRAGDLWRVDMAQRSVMARNVVIATGGVSYRATGSTGDGYLFAHRLGHTIVPLRPSLVSLKVDAPIFARVYENLRNVALTLVVEHREVACQMGEMTINGDVLEGAIVLRLSRDAVDALTDKKRAELRLSLKPALTQAKLVARIVREVEADGSLTVEGLLRRMVPRSLVRPVAFASGVATTSRVKTLTQHERVRIADTLLCMVLPLVDYGGFAEAVTTAGGVSLDEVDPLSMQSLKAPGIYFTGETLDIDADTGGYNLQLAFSTGYLCGKHIASQCKE